MIKLSVIVPVYNVEPYLEQCVESLLRQTLREIEIILVDDGSKDASGSICDAFAAKDERVRVLHKVNGGVSAARNDGLARATGEYVIFVDSDDYLPEDAFALLMQSAAQTQADIVIGDMIRVLDGREEYAQFYDKAFVTEDRARLDRLIQTVLYPNYCPNPHNGKPAFGYGGPCNKAVRRALLVREKIGFDLRVKGIYDDVIYSAYILAAAKKVAYIDKPVYYYRILGSSITRTYKQDMLKINRAIFTSWGEFLEKYNSSGVFTAAYYANVLRRFDESLGKYFFHPNYQGSGRARRRELSALLKEEPYCSIPVRAEYARLKKWHKVLFRQIAAGSALRVQAAYALLQLARRIRRK